MELRMVLRLMPYNRAVRCREMVRVKGLGHAPEERQRLRSMDRLDPHAKGHRNAGHNLNTEE